MTEAHPPFGDGEHDVQPGAPAHEEGDAAIPQRIELTPEAAETNRVARELFVDMERWFTDTLTADERSRALAAYHMKEAVVPGGSAVCMFMPGEGGVEVSLIQVHTAAPEEEAIPKTVQRRDFVVKEGAADEAAGLPAGYSTVERPANFNVGSAHWTEQAGSSDTLTKGRQFMYQPTDPIVTVQRGHDVPDPNINQAELGVLRQVAEGVPAFLTGGDITRRDVAQ